MAFDITDAKARMQGAQDALQRELGSIRTGRANPRILDRIEVEYYGAMTPLISQCLTKLFGQLTCLILA